MPFCMPSAEARIRLEYRGKYTREGWDVVPLRLHPCRLQEDTRISKNQ